MTHRETHKRKTKRSHHNNAAHSVYDVFQNLFLQIMGWILSLFGVCKSACINAYQNAPLDKIRDNIGKHVESWTQQRSKCPVSDQKSSYQKSEKRCIKFAFFDVVETKRGLNVKTLSYHCAVKRYCDIWFDLVRCYGFENETTGIFYLIMYPFVSLYILTWMPWIFWSLVWYQISWWFYSLGLSLCLLFLTIPLYLLCIVVGSMVMCSTWIPIIGAILGIGGIGPVYSTGGMFGCPHMPSQIHWTQILTYINCVPLLKLCSMNVCKNDSDCDDCEYDCDCDDCCDKCDPPTTTQPPTPPMGHDCSTQPQ